MARVLGRRLRLAPLRQQLQTACPWALQLLSPAMDTSSTSDADAGGRPTAPASPQQAQQSRQLASCSSDAHGWRRRAADACPHKGQLPGSMLWAWPPSAAAAVHKSAHHSGRRRRAELPWPPPLHVRCALHTGSGKAQSPPLTAVPKSRQPQFAQQQPQNQDQSLQQPHGEGGVERQPGTQQEPQQQEQQQHEKQQQQGPPPRPLGASLTSLPNLLSWSRVAMAPVISYQMATDQWGPAVALLAIAAVSRMLGRPRTA